MKICKTCQINKPYTDFFKNSKRKKHSSESVKYQSTCKLCYKIARAADYQKNKDYYKSKSLKKYGIDVTEFNRLKAEQNEVCACCKKPETRINYRSPDLSISELAVDHCHTTGKVRGLLCCKCNFAIGLLRDDTETLENIIRYLNAK